MALDLENERKYLVDLIKNAEKDFGKAQWAAQQAQVYAQQYPGFSLDKVYTPASSQTTSQTISQTTASRSSPTPSYGGYITTEQDGSKWYVSNGQQYRIADETIPEAARGSMGSLSRDQQGNQYFNYNGQSYLVGSIPGVNAPAAPAVSGVYQSPYSSKIEALLAKLNSIPAFNPNSVYSSPEYLAAKERIENESKKTSQNVLGAASSLTGGIPSSYAIAAAKESESDVKNRLNELLPSLTQAAYNRYLQEQGLTMDQINLLSSLQNADYQRYSTDRAFNQSVLESNRNFAQKQQEYNYQVSRDKLLDQRWLDQFDYQKKQDLVAQALRNREISIAERNAALARDKFNWEKDPTNPANMKNPKTIGALYSSMMNSGDPEKWLRQNAQWLDPEELKTLAGFLPKNEAVAILEKILNSK
ncbi:hypothetical protein BR63_11180 [Thermanaerosceptrum fracticalcis]|uniref:Uncharacterized protein n=1 Tax=Thermanaerosceptrum fracticalcis TaxID=1712410 RepID=A0A7G6E419_THEFR|nr:hypothetical protein [Thermanaerosceptrum fracticalcis]QNB46823.1 hypothetical protein BR63_11180 [Thermanaerosceptrum fracticalcis]